MDAIENEPSKHTSPRTRDPRARALLLAFGLLILVRLAYHATYLSLDPFAHATFSDGMIYETAARDVLAHPPLGSRPFYLQGAYSYLLALGMAIDPMPMAGLAVQLVLSALALAGALWALVRAFAWPAGAYSGLCLLAYFPLSFYENKYLSASFGVAANMAVWCALASALPAATATTASHTLRTGRALLIGCASALSILARPNLLLAVPFTLWAVLGYCEPVARRRVALALLSGLCLGLAPMAARNAWITGSPSVFPVHGGGTSFYIGNHPSADGRWNDAGGLLSGDVALERRELVQKLGLPTRSEAEDARAIGSALYARGREYVRSEPLSWLRLELRKLWLTLGNAELTQDYDLLGERELLTPWFGWGVPFSLLAACGLLGVVALKRRGTEQARAWMRLLLGQVFATLAANLIFFTSSQHRLPLAVALAALAGPGIEFAIHAVRGASRARSRGLLALAALLCAQGFVAREKHTKPSSAHYYNLSLVEEQMGELELAAVHRERAVERQPHNLAFQLEQASLLRRLGQFELALTRLDGIRAQFFARAPEGPLRPAAPAWVLRREAVERVLAEQHRTESFETLSPRR